MVSFSMSNSQFARARVSQRTMPRLVRAPIVAVLVAALVGPSLGAIQQWYKQTELPLPDSSFCNSCTCLADEWGFERCLPPISAERYWSNGLNAGTNGYDLTSTVTGLVGRDVHGEDVRVQERPRLEQRPTLPRWQR